MNGLDEKEVVNQRRKYGSNEITLGKKNGLIRLFVESLGDPIIRILLIALGIKTVFFLSDFDWYETIGIVVSIILSSFISVISEYGSSCAFESLMSEFSKIKCKVKRSGVIREVLIDEIVVGDLLVLSSGDKIGADGVVVWGSVDVDESMMNGESSSVVKRVRDVVYRGCVVYNGYALVRVDKVGNQSYYGRMVEELQVNSEISPLKERLNSLALFLSKIGYFCAVLVSFSYLFQMIFIRNSFDMERVVATVSDFSLMFAYFLHALTLSVTIIVVSVPDGFFFL